MANWQDIWIALGDPDYPDKVRTLMERSEAILDEVEDARSEQSSLLAKMNLKFELSDVLNQINTLTVLKSGLTQNLDAKNYKLINLANPIGNQDAATKLWTTTYVQATMAFSTLPSDADIHLLGTGGVSANRVLATAEDGTVESYASLDYPNSTPVLLLDFINSRSSMPTLIYSSSGTTSYYNKYNTLVSSTINEPIISYNSYKCTGYYNDVTVNGIGSFNIDAELSTTGTIVVEYDNVLDSTCLLSSGSIQILSSGTSGKLAIAYSATETRKSINGGSVTVGGTLGVLDTSISLLNDGTSPINGNIKSISIYANILTDIQLQALTS